MVLCAGRRVVGLGTSRAGEVFARTFVALNTVLAAFQLVYYLRHRGPTCEHDFAAWLLASSIISFVLTVFALMKLASSAIKASDGPSDVESQHSGNRSASKASLPWFYSNLPGTLDPFIGFAYVALAVWVVVGGVWTFTTSSAQGDCHDLRAMALWSVIGILVYAFLVAVVFTYALYNHRPAVKSFGRLAADPKLVAVVPAGAHKTSPTKDGVQSPSSQTFESPGGKADAVRGAGYTSGAPGPHAAANTLPMESKADYVQPPERYEGDNAAPPRLPLPQPPTHQRSASDARRLDYGYTYSSAGYMYRRTGRGPGDSFGRPMASPPPGDGHFRSATATGPVTEDQLRRAADAWLDSGFDPNLSVRHYLRATRSMPRVERPLP